MSSPFEMNPSPYALSGLASNVWTAALLTSLPQAVLLEESNRTIRIVNHQFCRLFQLPYTPDQLVGKSAAEIFEEIGQALPDPVGYQDRISSIIYDQRVVHKEKIGLADGRILLRDYVPVMQADVQMGHLWLFEQDVEPTTSDHLFKEQQKFFEKVLNSIPSDIAVFAPDQRYLYINPVGLRDPEVRKWLIGKTDYDYCRFRGKDMSLAENRSRMFNEIVASGREKEWEERLVNRQGEVEYHLRKMSPMYDEQGRFVWMIGYSVNITERKRFEQQVQASEKRYRDLFDYSQALICTHDLQGNFISVNPMLLEALGYRQEDIIGRNLREILFEEDKDNFGQNYLDKICAPENNKINGLFKVKHSNGKKIYLLFQNYKVTETPDTDAYIIAFAQDVTERIKAEKELRIAKKITEDTAKNKERFLANMSHEIRTPMNGILGITSFLQKTPLNEEQQRYLSIVHESANDLLTIINDILDLEKAGTGKIQLEKIPFDIVAKTRTIIRLFELPAKEKGTVIRLDHQLPDRLFVIGDPTRFNQILNNLVNNAIKFTHHGVITIRIVMVKETETEITLQFSVNDTGIGIDTRNLEKIFQPFTQAYPDTARKFGGSGLGLAITRNLLELQGGTIEVTSQHGKGSSFQFTIPYTKCNIPQPEKRRSSFAPANTLGPLNILLAEDNRVNQILTQGMLRQMGFIPTVAATGNEVIQLMNEHDYDIILMDIQMPEKSGLTAMQEIRKHPNPRKRAVPIVAFTANALHGEAEKYIAAGMNGYLTKPFTENELYQAITACFVAAPATTDFSDPSANQYNMSANTESSLYDLTLVSELAKGNKEFILNLAKIFIDTVPVTSAEMVEACQKEQWEQVGKLAHKLKSTIDTLNIQSLREDIRFIEKSGKENKNLEQLPEMVASADRIIQQAAAQLKAEFNI